MQDPNWEYDAVSVVGNAEVAKAFVMHANGWEFMQAWTSHASGDWLFFRRPKAEDPDDIRPL